MKNTYLVSYDLKKPDRNYQGLFGVLMKFSGWWHFLESTWLIKTEEDANSIFEKLKPHIDQDDSLLIIMVHNDYQGQLPKKAWDWINQNIW